MSRKPHLTVTTRKVAGELRLYIHRGTYSSFMVNPHEVVALTNALIDAWEEIECSKRAQNVENSPPAPTVKPTNLKTIALNRHADTTKRGASSHDVRNVSNPSAKTVEQQPTFKETIAKKRGNGKQKDKRSDSKISPWSVERATGKEGSKDLGGNTCPDQGKPQAARHTVALSLESFQKRGA